MASPPPLIEPIGLDEVKAYLRVTDNLENAKIEAMIPRARLWVEEHTGLALIKREFTEQHIPESGVIRLYRGPVFEVSTVGYAASATAGGTVEPAYIPPSGKLTMAGGWPSTYAGSPFIVIYTAGFEPGEIDARLIGAMLTLIEGEYTAGFAYPEDAVTAAVNATFYMKFVAP